MSKLELEIAGPSSFKAECFMQQLLDYLESRKRLWNYEETGKMHIYHCFTKESGRIIQEGEKE